MTASGDVSTLVTTQPKFGHSLRSQFLFAPNYRNLNHGSFGSPSRSVIDAMRTFQDATEAAPDRNIRYQKGALLDESRAQLATLLNTPVDTIVMIPNATTGVNTVLRAITWEAGDVIIHFSTIYGACERTILYVTDTTAAESVLIPVVYPCSNESILQALTETVSSLRCNGKNPRLCLFDTVSSVPGMRMPFEKLIALCRTENMLSLVDGAHGIGHISIDLGSLQPDFFVSNCHKWLYTPRGTAVFYVRSDRQNLINSSVPTSHYYIPKSGKKSFNPLGRSTKSNFHLQFEFAGTVDFTPYYCVPAALKFRQEIGGEKAILEYITNLASAGGEIVAAILGTQVMALDPAAVNGGKVCMVNVELPIPGHMAEGEEVANVYEFLSEMLAEKYDTYIMCFVHGGKWWARLSGQVYLEMEDFEWAGKVLKEMCARVESGDY